MHNLKPALHLKGSPWVDSSDEVYVTLRGPQYNQFITGTELNEFPKRFGRFRNYDPDECFPFTTRLYDTGEIIRMLSWIAAHVENRWCLVGGFDKDNVKIWLTFEDENEAVMFQLAF